MEKVTFYQALIEFRRKKINWNWENENCELQWVVLNTFKNKEDAEKACRLYGIAYNSVYIDYNVKCTGNHRVDNVSYPKQLTKGPDYISLDEFIQKNEVVQQYKNHIAEENMKKLLKEIGVNTEKEKNLRIIERMIRDYQYQIKINENLPVDVEGYKENVKFLEDLRDGKIELK